VINTLEHRHVGLRRDNADYLNILQASSLKSLRKMQDDVEHKRKCLSGNYNPDRLSIYNNNVWPNKYIDCIQNYVGN